MAHGKEEEDRIIVQILQLVNQLSPQGREQVLDRLMLENMQREIQEGIDSADRGELVPGDVVLNRLRQRAERRMKEQKSQ